MKELSGNGKKQKYEPANQLIKDKNGVLR